MYFCYSHLVRICCFNQLTFNYKWNVFLASVAEPSERRAEVEGREGAQARVSACARRSGGPPQRHHGSSGESGHMTRHFRFSLSLWIAGFLPSSLRSGVAVFASRRAIAPQPHSRWRRCAERRAPAFPVLRHRWNDYRGTVGASALQRRECVTLKQVSSCSISWCTVPHLVDALPTLTALIRGPFGRHAWTMQYRQMPRQSKVQQIRNIYSLIFEFSVLYSTSQRPCRDPAQYQLLAPPPTTP